MSALHIKNANILHGDELIIELTDGRTITLSFEKLLTLIPDSVMTEEEAAADNSEPNKKSPGITRGAAVSGETITL